MVCLFGVAGSRPLPQGWGLVQLGRPRDAEKEAVWPGQGPTKARCAAASRRLPGMLYLVPSAEPVTGPDVWMATVPPGLSPGLGGVPVCPTLSLQQHQVSG